MSENKDEFDLIARLEVFEVNCDFLLAKVEYITLSLDEQYDLEFAKLNEHQRDSLNDSGKARLKENTLSELEAIAKDRKKARKGRENFDEIDAMSMNYLLSTAFVANEKEKFELGKKNTLIGGDEFTEIKKGIDAEITSINNKMSSPNLSATELNQYLDRLESLRTAVNRVFEKAEKIDKEILGGMLHTKGKKKSQDSVADDILKESEKMHGDILRNIVECRNKVEEKRKTLPKESVVSGRPSATISSTYSAVSDKGRKSSNATDSTSSGSYYLTRESAYQSNFETRLDTLAKLIEDNRSPDEIMIKEAEIRERIEFYKTPLDKPKLTSEIIRDMETRLERTLNSKVKYQK